MKYVKLIAKPNTWYVEGTEVWDYDDERRVTKEEWEKMQVIGCYRGIRKPDLEYEIKLFGTDFRVDGECCSPDEFVAEETDSDGRKEIAQVLERYTG